VFGDRGRLLLVNPQAEKFFNIQPQKIIGKTVLGLSGFSELKTLTKLLGPKVKKLFRQELVLSEELNLEVSTVPMVSGKEQLGTLVILHDVSREKIIERMKTEFVSLAAHQLKTPLSGIKWTLKMFLDKEFGEMTKEQMDYIEKTYNANERMISLINDLLNVARIEEGRYIYKPSPTDFEEVIQGVIDIYQKNLKDKNLKLSFKKPKVRLPSVPTDIEKMTLAVENLVSNAIKYTLKGGTITISFKSDKDELEIAVADTGLGIPKEQQARVFTKFFRGTNVMKKETEGTGLGLFIAQNIIKAHKGKIWFESTEDKGTTFHVSLPVKK